MGAKGTQTSTSTSQTTAAPEAMALYRKILEQAQGIAATPFTPFTGELVAPLTQQQQLGIANINTAAGFGTPMIQDAARMVQTAGQPLTEAQIQQYMNPFTRNVVDATQAQFAAQNARQQQQILGNAIAQGALGGNRSAIAQAELAGQQSLSQSPVIADLMSKGYLTGLSTAQDQQRAQLAAAQQLGSLGISGQQAALAGAGAQLEAGGLEQRTRQMQNEAALQQFLTQQADPFQKLSWLAGIGTGVGSQMGSRSTGTQTQPGPSPFSGILGGVTSLVGGLGRMGLFSDERVKENIKRIGKTNDGQNIYRFNYKGDPTTHIGFLAQEVEDVHPEAVGEVNGVKTVDYATATDDALKRADGGGISPRGSIAALGPFSRISGGINWVPQERISSGGMPQARATAAPIRDEPAPDFMKQAKELGALAGNIYESIRSDKNKTTDASGNVVAADNAPGPAANAQQVPGVAPPPAPVPPPPSATGSPGVPRPIITDVPPGAFNLASLRLPNAVFNRGGAVHGYAYGGAPETDEPPPTIDLTPGVDFESAEVPRLLGVREPSIVEQQPGLPTRPVPDREQVSERPVPVPQEQSLVARPPLEGVAPSGRQVSPPAREPAPRQGIAPRMAALPQRIDPEIPPLQTKDTQVRMGVSPRLQAEVKKFEGFTPKASWDYKQHSVGYGTKAAYPGEVIDRPTGEVRLNSELLKAQGIVDRFAPNLPPGVRDALTSLTFNTGSKWTGSGLGRAILAGDFGGAKQRLLQYVKAGGKVLPGLVQRRREEASWFDAPASDAAERERETEGGIAPTEPRVQLARNEGIVSDAPPPEAEALSAPRPPRGISPASEGVAEKRSPTKSPGLFPNIDLSAESKLWDALMAAGFTMMGSRSPTLAGAIGEGGMAGMQTYAAGKEYEQKQAQLQQKADIEAEKERYERDLEERKLEIQKLRFDPKYSRVGVPTGYRRTDDGGLEPIPGGPKDPETVRKLAEMRQGGATAGNIRLATEDLEAPDPTKYDEWKTLYGEEGADIISRVSDEHRGLLLSVLSGRTRVRSLPIRVRMKYLELASNIDPNFNEGKGDARFRVQQLFAGGSPESRSINSMNNTTQHVAALRDLYRAMHNGDYKLVNHIRNEWRRQTGKDLPASMDAIIPIVAGEVNKVVVPGGGGQEERKTLAEVVSADLGPEAFLGATEQWLHFAGTQMVSLKHQWVAAGLPEEEFMEKRLVPGTARLVREIEGKQRALGTLVEGEKEESEKGTAPKEPKLPPPDKRKVGETYQTPGGRLVTWDGKGLTPVEKADTVPERTDKNLSSIIEETESALAKGAPREKIIERLRKQGVDPSSIPSLRETKEVRTPVRKEEAPVIKTGLAPKREPDEGAPSVSAESATPPSDNAKILDEARAAIARNPTARAMVIDRLRKLGVDPALL